MKYELNKATEKNFEYLEKAKLYNIFQYAYDLDQGEIDRINKYVKNHIPMEIENYRIINVNNNIVGCLLVCNKYDGIIIDDIYLEEQYRNKGIGTNIIKEILCQNKIVYLWVYKENTKAISLYEKLGFKIVEETKTRYFMKYDKN